MAQIPGFTGNSYQRRSIVAPFSGMFGATIGKQINVILTILDAEGKQVTGATVTYSKGGAAITFKTSSLSSDYDLSVTGATTTTITISKAGYSTQVFSVTPAVDQILQITRTMVSDFAPYLLISKRRMVPAAPVVAPEFYTPVVIIAGQSNAGSLTLNQAGALPADLQKAIPDTYISGTGGFVPLTGTGDPAVLKTGIEYKLGDLFTPYYQKPLYLIKYAAGGTALVENASATDWNASSTNEAYASLVSITQNRLDILAGQGLNPKVMAFYWYQGESDAQNNRSKDLYKSELNELFQAFRSQHFNTRFMQGASLPIFLVRIKTWSSIPGIAPIRTAQAEVAAEGSNITLISVDDLASNPNDAIHLTTASQVLLGERIFNQIKTLYPKPVAI